MGFDSTLQYNTGVQDQLLQDKHNSLFIHPGYVKSTLAQQSLSDLRPTQDTKYFGNSIKFTIPPMADLLGPVDLMLDLAEAALADRVSGLRRLQAQQALLTTPEERIAVWESFVQGW